MGKILVAASERARTESLGSMMDSCHARSVSLGTPSGLCDRPRQSGVVAAQRIPGSREPHSQSPPTEPAPTVGWGAVHLGRDRETTGTQSPEGYRASCQAGHHPRLVSTLGGPEVRWVRASCLSRPPSGASGGGGAGG